MTHETATPDTLAALAVEHHAALLAHPDCTPELAAGINAAVQAAMSAQVLKRMSDDGDYRTRVVRTVGAALWDRVHADCDQDCICNADPSTVGVHSSRRRALVNA